MYTITARQELSYFDIRSAIQKATRRCKIRDVLYSATEMDLSGLGNAVFVNFLMFCSEDVGPAEPKLVIEIYREYQAWKEALKEEGKKPRDSFQSFEARKHLLQAAYMMGKARKSRVVDYAMHQFEKKSYPEINVEEALNAFKEALYSRDLETTLETLDTLTRKLVDQGGRKVTPFKKVWKVVRTSKVPEEVAPILEVMEKVFSITLKKCIRFPLVHACLLLTQDDYQIRDVPRMTSQRTERYAKRYYSNRFIHDVMRDYVYDMHTAEGRRRGRGLQHFIQVGAKVENLGYPELYKEDFIKAREHRE